MLAFHRFGADYHIAKLVKSLYTVPETIALPALFNAFIEKRLHISLIIDEYGDIQGIITLEDIFECLLGVDIIDERDGTLNMRQKAIQMAQQRVTQHKNLIDDFDQLDDDEPVSKKAWENKSDEQ